MIFPRGREVRLGPTALILVDVLVDAVLALPLTDRFPNPKRREAAWLGYAGEVALAQTMGWPMPEPMRTMADTRRLYDVGWVQVRTRAREGWDLMIAPRDEPKAGQPFVLVVPWRDRWLVQGWAYGVETMLPERWTGDPDHHLHGVVPYDCWATPAADLRDLETLDTAPREA